MNAAEFREGETGKTVDTHTGSEGQRTSISSLTEIGPRRVKMWGSITMGTTRYLVNKSQLRPFPPPEIFTRWPFSRITSAAINGPDHPHQHSGKSGRKF